jgi:hypothetical protein
MTLLRPLADRWYFKKRYDVLNYLVRKRGYRVYLEIGTATGRCLERVRCRDKTGVDPSPRVVRPEWNLRKMTSDAFFATNERKFDLIFIDGLHLAEQVVRDIYNSLAALNPGGAVLLHDCNPPSEATQLRDALLADGGKWNGDTWKAIVYMRKYLPGLFTRVLDLDQGIGIIIPSPQDAPPRYDAAVAQQAEELFRSLSWSDLEKNRGQLLGLIDNRNELETELRSAGLMA